MMHEIAPNIIHYNFLPSRKALPVESAKWGDHRVDASAQRTVLMIKTVNKLKWDEMEKAVIMANR